MSRLVFFVLYFSVASFMNHESSAVYQQTTQIPAGLRRLAKAYPDFIERVEENKLIWKDGTEMIYNDGRIKSFEELYLKSSDLEDMMVIPYPAGIHYNRDIPKNFDPGAIRDDAFFKKMYGKTFAEVRKNMVPIIWLPNSSHITLWVTRVNGIDKKLTKISQEIDKLPSRIKKFVDKPEGTWVWRDIMGTNLISMHSLGIAFDVNLDPKGYWRWQYKDLGAEITRYHHHFPLEIVAIFEKQGFIWGGKWYHYDTMHFEYRPELLLED